MADWIDHLTIEEAQAVLDAPVKTRYPARNDRGEKVTRYVAVTAAERTRLEAKANG